MVAHARSRTILPILLCLVALVGAACGGDPEEPGATTPAPVETSEPPTGTPGGEDGDLAGTWNGTYSSMLGATGTFVVEFTQNGNAIQGSIEIEGSTCVTSGEIAGTLTGNQITFGAVEGEVTITFTGVLDGDHLEGEYDAPDPACSNDSGTWEADRAA